ncbi:hypothetical protein CAPTEDRAFT_217237 [Capitella teleta]|uniref:Endonuclease/exonuclease/phosphatase domain-containing protein n=1 Tax=Capitella teleta TaxID=283909 RepID=R7TBL9_CAPTE|nr:hypothetical protein CAPTEDRAFT_217237 [Capitella teleta]|eukprot:ELT90867.1 hypothetical protein CAPTEDRAFT_217237 [Capitella teleta]
MSHSSGQDNLLLILNQYETAFKIRESGCDVITFQEVRSDEDRNQLHELRSLLPQYKWLSFAVAHDVDIMDGVYIRHWQREGIGILSRYPIESQSVQRLTYTKGPDSNRRIALHVNIAFPDPGIIHFVIVHLSYDRYQQCGNMHDILQSEQTQKSEYLVILGDFNAYPDFEGPFQLFNSSSWDSNNPCIRKNRRLNFLKHLRPLSDAWRLSGIKGGNTFSNMPAPGMVSRPDRIFVSANLAIAGAELMGDGHAYKSRFLYHILWHRVGRVIDVMRDSWLGQRGRSCVHDCGPHASCRCGVCVGGNGDQNVCMLPDCAECSAVQYNFYCLAIIVLITLSVQLIYGALQVLLTLNDQSKKNRSSAEKETGIFGSCCLCDPELYRSINARIRRHRRSLLCRIWPFLLLPPMVLVMVTVLLLCLYVAIVMFVFKDAFDDVSSVLPEEFFPSDHLMLSVLIHKQ